MTEISVVIPTHRRPQILRRSLRAVCNDPGAAEIVVVHDEADRATQDVISGFASADRRVRALPAPRDEQGLERGQAARTAGVRSARAEVVLALDDDVVAHPGLVSGHARHHRERRGRVVVGYMPVVLPPRGVPGRAVAQLYAAGYEAVVREYARSAATVLPLLWGGNVSCSRDSWLAAERAQVSGAYHGDQALGLALAQLGLDAIFDPALRGDHWYRRSLEGLALDARSAAVGRRNLNSAHPGTHPERDQSSRRRYRLALNAVHRVGGGDPALAGLAALGSAAARRRLHGMEHLAARLTWRLAYDHARGR